MAKIVILGAGLTGLSTAYHLEEKGFYDYKIFEKESTYGGLCRSLTQDGFTFDYTGHLLHIQSQYGKEFINKIINLENFNELYRQSYIYSQETFTRYPYQINTFGLPIKTISECVEGFVKRKKSIKPKNYHDWIEKHFGKGFGKHFFFNFDSKKFAIDIKKLSTSTVENFAPKTSLEEIITGATQDINNTNIGYNSKFFYPKRNGIGLLVQTLGKSIKNSIELEFDAKIINLKERLIRFKNGHEEKFEILINTIPLDSLLKKMKEKSNSYLKNTQNKLLCNSVLNFNLGIKDNNISKKHWVYFPEKKYPFYRIGFPFNFSKTLTPPNCSSISGEIAFLKKNKPKFNKSIDYAKQIFKINKITTTNIININHAYVIYDFWRDKNLKKILKNLNEKYIYSIGRYGAWKYSTMENAILDGKEIADKLITQPAKKDYNLTEKNKFLNKNRKYKGELQK